MQCFFSTTLFCVAYRSLRRLDHFLEDREPFATSLKMEGRMQGPVFVIIRFPLSRFQACKNSLMKNLSVHRNYSGAVSGLSRKLQVIEGSWRRDRGVAILSFQSYREAQLWKDSVPEIRQPDWMDGVDLIMVPVAEMPPENKRFIQILDLHFLDFERFLADYSSVASGYMHHSGASSGVVSTRDVMNVKGGWVPEFIVINFWTSPEEFEAAYTSEEYQPMKEKRFTWADTNSVVFDLEPLVASYYVEQRTVARR